MPLNGARSPCRCTAVHRLRSFACLVLAAALAGLGVVASTLPAAAADDGGADYRPIHF